MEDHYYPQEITSTEAALGFRRYSIGGIGALMGSQSNPIPVPVVACILSPSDILIKITFLGSQIAYSHRRHGRSKITKLRLLSWSPVSNPVVDARKFIQDFRLGVYNEALPNRIEPVPFDFQEIKPEV